MSHHDDDATAPVPFLQRLLDNPFLLLFLGCVRADGRLQPVGRHRHPDDPDGQVTAARHPPQDDERHPPPLRALWWKHPIDRVEGTWIASR
jgi:hypothetical protein